MMFLAEIEGRRLAMEAESLMDAAARLYERLTHQVTDPVEILDAKHFGAHATIAGVLGWIGRHDPIFFTIIPAY